MRGGDLGSPFSRILFDEQNRDHQRAVASREPTGQPPALSTECSPLSVTISAVAEGYALRKGRAQLI